MDCEGHLCSCLAMFNFNLGIEEFQYSSKSCLFVWSPTSQGQILPRPLQTGPTCFWKGFLQTRHNFKPQQFQTQFDHLSIWSSRKWWDAFERVKTRTLRCALGFLKKNKQVSQITFFFWYENDKKINYSNSKWLDHPQWGQEPPLEVTKAPDFKRSRDPKPFSYFMANSWSK